ncbi:MAG TPA: substrate-binding domain-containing protein [Verrucomicrobiae bacterium]|jgi:DNA-binding LacI/PurR family transcriptional regulator
MHRLPKRRSLIAETAGALKQWITDGDLNEMLPGELRLKELLGVGRNTLRQALKMLEKEQWISAPGQGRQRRVQKQRVEGLRPALARLPVTFLSPFATVDRILLLEMEDLQMHLSEQGRELRFIAPNIFHLQKPERHLQRLVRENPSAAWILHFVTEAMQRWFEKEGIPAFLYGSPYPEVPLPFVVNDWESAAFHAGLQLARQGHRRIGLLALAPLMPGGLAIHRGLQRALADFKPEAQVQMLSGSTSPRSVAQSLEAAFRGEARPTALVFCSSSHLLTCLSWFVSEGIAVPRDVSLVCVPSDSWFQELHPPVCHYENNSHIFARQVRKKVMELVEIGRVIGPSARVPLEYVAGATIGPAPEAPGPLGRPKD